MWQNSCENMRFGRNIISERLRSTDKTRYIRLYSISIIVYNHVLSRKKLLINQLFATIGKLKKASITFAQYLIHMFDSCVPYIDQIVLISFVLKKLVAPQMTWSVGWSYETGLALTSWQRLLCNCKSYSYSSSNNCNTYMWESFCKGWWIPPPHPPPTPQAGYWLICEQLRSVAVSVRSL